MEMTWKQVLAILILTIFVVSLYPTWRPQLITFSQTVLGKLVFICIILFYAEMNITYGFLALVFVVFFYKIFFTMTPIHKISQEEPIFSKKTVEFPEYTPVPLVIYQTWHSKSLPPKMSECVEKLKSTNPAFDHYLYDDNDCRAFIKENYDADVLAAYDKLIPGAYKADLWRYCVLYKMGGIYLDIKFQCEPGFTLMEMTADNETFILDRPSPDIILPIQQELVKLQSPDIYDYLIKTSSTNTWKNGQIGLYNAIIASVPNNPILYECIQQVVKNVKNKIYGYCPLYPTGPGLLGEIYFKNNYKNLVKKMKYFNSTVGTYILNKKQKVLSQYPEYREEQRRYTPSGPNYYYHDLWVNQSIYVSIDPTVIKSNK
jgi:mannosyltransferase OCH1-like enzyme